MMHGTSWVEDELSNAQKEYKAWSNANIMAGTTIVPISINELPEVYIYKYIVVEE